jgi:hypothetical protein
VKKVFLIAAGTVTGLGAVLSITPPALSDSAGSVGLTGGTGLGGGSALPANTPAASAPTQSATTPKATPTPSKSATTTKKSTPTSSATASSQPSATATPTPTATHTPTGFSGTVNGSPYNARNYGTLSLSVTFSNGAITSVRASQSPMSWSQQSLSVLIPWVNAGNITVEQVKQYSAAQLPCSTSNSCNSRASYTAEAFWSSLKSAITKAGL